MAKDKSLQTSKEVVTSDKVKCEDCYFLCLDEKQTLMKKGDMTAYEVYPCRRMPETFLKDKSEWCGMFKAREE